MFSPHSVDVFSDLARASFPNESFNHEQVKKIINKWNEGNDKLNPRVFAAFNMAVETTQDARLRKRHARKKPFSYSFSSI